MTWSGDRSTSINDLANLQHAERLLATFSPSCAIGFGICDRQLRFRCINNVLAASNGFLPEAHLGNTIREVLGPITDIIEPAFRRVLATGHATIVGNIPSRDGTVSWIASYFPVKNASSRVQLIGAIAIEVTELMNLDTHVRRVTAEQSIHADVKELHRSVRGYFASLNTYLRAMTQQAWDLDKSADEQLAPAIVSLDQRIVHMQSLVIAVASRFRIEKENLASRSCDT